MALPIVPIIVGAAVGGASSAVVGAYVGPLLTPTQRSNTAAANAETPNTVPSVEACVDAFWRQQITRDEFIRVAGANGIVVAPADMTADAWRRAGATPAQVQSYRQGAQDNQGHGVIWQKILASRKPSPDIASVYTARFRGLVPEAQFGALLARAGGDPFYWQQVSQLWETVPTLGPLYEAKWRGVITPERFDYWLTRNGYADPEARAIVSSGLHVLPPISDLLRFSHKEAFAPEVAGELGFFEEFPVEAQKWIEKQGLTGGPGFTGSASPLPAALAERLNIVQTPDPAAPGRVIRELTWLDLYNAAEWQPISPTQSYEMLHRLRPGATARYDRALGLPAGTVKPFTQADVYRWLRIADYPTSVRDSLAAISYAVMRLIDIRSVHSARQFGAGSDEWARGQLLDRGYTPDDATTTVTLWNRQIADRARAPAALAQKRAAAKLVEQARESYRIGVTTRAALRESLATTGMAAAAIDLVVSVEDNASNLDILRSTLKRVQGDIRAGVLTETQGVTALTAAGFLPERAAAYARQARLQITVRRQQVTTGQILKWVGEGILPAAVAAVRLGNLGWSNPDVLLMLQSAAGTLRQLQSRQITQAQGASRRNAAELAKLRKESIALTRQVESDLRRIQPIGQMKKFLDKGILAERTVIARLVAQGYPPQAVAEYLALWRKEREKEGGQTNGQPAPAAAGDSPDTDPAGPASAGG